VRASCVICANRLYPQIANVKKNICPQTDLGTTTERTELLRIRKEAREVSRGWSDLI